jgi:hypothetical protein
VVDYFFLTISGLFWDYFGTNFGLPFRIGGVAVLGASAALAVGSAWAVVKIRRARMNWLQGERGGAEEI